MTKRLRLALACLLLIPASVSAAVTQAQTLKTVSGDLFPAGDPTETLTFDSAVTIGNTVALLVMWGREDRTMTSCTLDGNAMTAIHTGTATSPGVVSMFARVATTTGQAVVCTLSGSDSTAAAQMTIWELAGMAAVLSEGGTSTVSEFATVTTATGPTVTPDVADSFFYGGIWLNGNSGGWTSDPPTGYTLVAANNTMHTYYQIVSAGTGKDLPLNWTTSRSGEVALANLDGAAAATPKCCGSGFPGWVLPGMVRR